MSTEDERSPLDIETLIREYQAAALAALDDPAAGSRERVLAAAVLLLAADRREVASFEDIVDEAFEAKRSALESMAAAAEEGR